MLKPVKMLRSYNAHAQFLAEAHQLANKFLSSADAVADGKPIPSPYRYSPSHAVYEWKGKRVVWFEVAHRKFQVYAVPADVKLFSSEDAAARHYLKSLPIKNVLNADSFPDLVAAGLIEDGK